MKLAKKYWILGLFLLFPVVFIRGALLLDEEETGDSAAQQGGFREELEEKAAELILFGETTIKGIKIVQKEDGGLEATLEEPRPVSLLDIPGFNSISIPGSLKNLISKVTIDDLTVETDGNFVGLSGKANVFGKTGIPVKLRGIKQGGKLVWAQWINLPADMTLSKLIPQLKAVNIGLSDAALAFSSYGFDDSNWTGKINQGTTLVGKLVLPKALANQVKIAQDAIFVKGTLKKGWTGSTLEGSVGGKKVTFTIEDGSLVIASGDVKVTVGEKKAIAVGASEVEMLPEGGFKASVEAGEVSLLQIPGFDKLPIPKELRDKFGNVKITDLKISGTKELINIAGKTSLFGAVVDALIRGQRSGGSYNWSVRLAVPDNFKLTQIASIFKPVDFTVNKGFFMLSQSDFEDAAWGGKISKGTSFAGDFKVEGVLKALLDAVGKNLNEVRLRGLLKPGWVGSSLTMRLGTVDLGSGIKTDEMYLGIGVGANKTPTLAITTDINIPVSPPVEMKAEISGDLTQGISIKGELPGKLKLPNIPLEIEDFGIDAKLGVGATLGFKAKTNIGSKVLDMFVCLSPPVLIGSGDFKGGLKLEDIVKLASDAIGLATKKKVDLVGPMKSAIPNIGLDFAKLEFAPRPLVCAGKPLKAGIVVDTAGNIFGKRVEFSAQVGQDGLKMRGFLEKVELGPLVIAGFKGDKGAEVEFEATTQGKFKAYIDGQLGLNLGPLGTSSSKTHIDLNPTGAVFEVKTDILGNLFLVGIEGKIGFSNPLDSYGVFVFEQSALTKFAGLLSKAAEEIAKARKEVLRARDKAIAGLEQESKKIKATLEKSKKDAERELNKAKENLKALERERDAAKRNFEKARAEVQKPKRELDKAKAALRKAHASINWSLKGKLDRAQAKCDRASWLEQIVVCRERDALAIAWAASEGAKALAKGGLKVAELAVEAAKGPFSAAQGLMIATEETYKGVLAAVQEASKGVLNATNELQKAGQALGGFLAADVGLGIAKGTVYGPLTGIGLSMEATEALINLTADLIAKGFNITKVRFETKFSDLASGKLPKATIEGFVFGKPFNVEMQLDLKNIGNLAESIINKVFG